MPPSFYCGLLFFAWLLLLLSIWRIVRIPTATTTTIQSTTLNSVRTATPALKAAYTTLVQYVKTQHGPEWNVVLIGNDPCSISASEGGPQGLRSDAPWAMDLWRNSRPSTWENPYFDKPDDWKSERVPLQYVYGNMTDSYTTQYNITSINDLFVDSTSFILSPVGLKSKVRAAIALWNDLAVRAYINEFYVASWTKNNNKECPAATARQKILHTIGIVSDKDIATLKSWKYGVSYDKYWKEGMQIYSAVPECLVSANLCKLDGSICTKLPEPNVRPILNSNHKDYCEVCANDEPYSVVTEDITNNDNYMQITGLCGNEKYATAAWMNSYDKPIRKNLIESSTIPYAKGTIPSFNTDIVPGGEGFCASALTHPEVKDCKSKVPLNGYGHPTPDGKYTLKSVCKLDHRHCVLREWGIASTNFENGERFNTFRTTPLYIDFNMLHPDNMSVVAKDFDALHKVWGAGGNNPQRGVHKDNIWLDHRIVNGNDENVLVMQVQGDLATSGSWGVQKGNEIKPGDNCAPWVPYEIQNGESAATGYRKVGAVMGTRDMFGSGSYEVEAMVPRGNDDKTTGMGYVWAMWTFGYQELYTIPDKLATDSDLNLEGLNQLMQGSLTTPWFDADSTKLTGDKLKQASNYQTCGPGTTVNDDDCDNSFSCGMGSVLNCHINDAPYTSWVSEIDIEIPANPQLSPRGQSWKHKPAVCGCSNTDEKCDCSGNWGGETINFNTWRGDDEAYNNDSPYTQHCVKAPDTLISEGSYENKYRKYRFDWYAAGITKEGKSFGKVEFYVDGKLLHTATRYIPTRAVRLVFGPWFGWWAGDANFDIKEVLVRSIRITPFTEAMEGAKGIAAGFNVMYPQTYDQCNPDSTHTQICDFKALDDTRCEPDTCAEANINNNNAKTTNSCTTKWKKNRCLRRKALNISVNEANCI